MVLVGLSMPSFISGPSSETAGPASSYIAQAAIPDWGTIGWYVLIVTVLANLGKMFPAFTYRKEAHWKERLAVAIGMWPRGEVGAGVLVISLGYGLGGPLVTVAVLCLALNLLLTGFFIWIVKRLLKNTPTLAPKT
jgi:Kef-type K+ transport system membrane component KefB